MYLRDFSDDFRAFTEVLVGNEYRLPDELPPDGLILDIGAHIGCFALACIRRGARRIVCVEPEPANYELLCHNTAPYQVEVTRLHGAVWRSDRPTSLQLIRPVDGSLTARSQMREAAEDAPHARGAIALDDLLRELGRVSLLKLDCEGAEYPILYTSRELHRVERIVGETHEKIPWEGSPLECSLAGVCGFLAGQGFEVEAAQRNEYVNNFYATRRD